ncbi:hypothetical protein [Pseudomonas sp. NFX98]|uniref:hypothetical protein n=1 Tax=Pseudomonas sp. NFX98 TaxID=3399122 RepID=UPI0039FBC399
MLEGTKSVNKIWIVLAIILTLLGLAIFGTYAHYLPKISDDHTAWSSFGSLLSGFFTLGGVIATIATLLFLNAQNKNQQDFIEWQKQALSFDQYINHRKLFIERLSELQIVCNNQIRFSNPDRLYNSLFPNNSPTKIFLTVKPDRSDESHNLLGDLGSLLEKVETDLDKAVWDGVSARQFAFDLIIVKDHLQIEWTGEDSDGDILVDGKNTGINIYSINEFCSKCSLIFDSFLHYSGNAPFKGFMKGTPRYVREALIECFSRPWKDIPIKALKSIEGLSSLEYLLFHIDSMRDASGNWVLPMTYKNLARAFSSREEVLKLRDYSRLSHLVKIGVQEVEWTLELSANNKANQKTFHDLLTCAEMFNALNDLFEADKQQDFDF